MSTDGKRPMDAVAVDARTRTPRVEQPADGVPATPTGMGAIIDVETGVDQAEIDAGALEAAATPLPAVQGGRIVTGSARAAGWPSVRVGVPASWSRCVRYRRRCLGTGATRGARWHGPCPPRRAFGMPIEESRFVRSHPPAPRRIGRPGRVRWGEPKAFQRLRATRAANPEARQP